MDKELHILLLFVHPYPRHSRVNHALMEAAERLKNVEVRDLYQLYPDFYIDVEAEQEKVRTADLIVFQHPFYWYSAPALLKQWQDAVLLHGFAYGAGSVLHGKRLLSAVTTNYTTAFYNSGGAHAYQVVELLYPYEQMAHYCGMQYLEPFIVYEARTLRDEEIAARAEDYRIYLIERSRGAS